MTDGTNVLTRGFNNGEWEEFAKSKLLIFMEENGLDKASIDDGCGRKATLRKNKNGEWVSNITLSEKF